MKDVCRQVYVEESVREYLVRIIRATRENSSIRLGASPRAAQGLYAAAQARAALSGRAFVLPDDVKFLAGLALSHRLILKSETRLKGKSGEDVVRQVVESVEAPVL